MVEIRDVGAEPSTIEGEGGGECRERGRYGAGLKGDANGSTCTGSDGNDSLIDRAEAAIERICDKTCQTLFGSERALWRGSTPWTSRDTVLLALIGLVTTLLNGWGVATLEFFRHTEADRTLIAWEMTETKEYLLPHLLHSLILTKPPLFYWILSGNIALFGEATEAVARFPSVIVSALFAMMQFSVFRLAGATRYGAMLQTVILVTGMSFFVLGNLAEIDMLFGFLCASSFSLLYLGIANRSGVATVLAYTALGLAVLAKGPPAAVFFGVGLIAAVLLYRSRPESSRPFFRWNLLGVLIAALLVGPWLSAVSHQVGWGALRTEFRREILNRIFEEAHHVRGPEFYLGALFTGHLLWSLLIPIALFIIVRERSVAVCRGALTAPGLRPFVLFHVSILVATFVMLTAAQGKSNRYIFPAYGAACIGIFWLCLVLQNREELRSIYRIVWRGLLPLSAALMIAGLVVSIPGVSVWGAAVSGVAIGSCGVVLALAMRLAGRSGKHAAVVASLLLLMFALRIGYTEVYAPGRNAKRSVKPVVEAIDRALPKEAVLYNIEIFERWVSFYLKRGGRESYRLTPAEAAQPRVAADGLVYLLIDSEEEAWRLEQLKTLDPEMREVVDLRESEVPCVVVAVHPEILPKLAPHAHFPTTPSAAYYNDPELARVWVARGEGDEVRGGARSGGRGERGEEK